MMQVYIGGAPFVALGHRDGRFMRAAGLFALARRRFMGGPCILHLELTEAINRSACAAHPRWGWALSEGMDCLLVHIAGGRARLPDDMAHGETVTWHPQAQVVFDRKVQTGAGLGAEAPEPFESSWWLEIGHAASQAPCDGRRVGRENGHAVPR